MSSLPTVASLRVDSFRNFTDARGTLVAIELAQAVSFSPKRIFWITGASPGATRGQHGHKRCQQYMVCCEGRVDIDAFDGSDRRSFTLERGQALLIPPLIYTAETYLTEDSLLLVVCDQPFDKDDYIHSRDELISVRGQKDALGPSLGEDDPAHRPAGR